MQRLEISGALLTLYGSLGVKGLNCNFNKEQSMLPEDDSMNQTCRSVLNVLL